MTSNSANTQKRAYSSRLCIALMNEIKVKPKKLKNSFFRTLSLSNRENNNQNHNTLHLCLLLCSLCRYELKNCSTN